MAVRGLRRVAAARPVPVFVARGGGSGLLPLEFVADERLQVVATPRHASVLVAAGRFPGPMGVALDRVHDQMPHPRGTVWWTAATDGERPAALHQATAVRHADAAVAAVVDVYRGLLVGDRPSEADVGKDMPPHAFEGRGDYGQGGEGMMGGVPYGRPMAMTADDRDGLALDQVSGTFGPFLFGLPNGVQVEGALQGGVVQTARLVALDLGDGPRLDPADESAAPYRHSLRWLTGALLLGGLGALAARAAGLAGRPWDPARHNRLVRRVRGSGLLSAWRGIGVVDGEDARDRLERLLSEPGVVSTPPDLDRVGAMIVGQDWSDALVTIWSFDLRIDRVPFTTSDTR